MRWYVSKNNNRLNRRAFTPELYTNYICVNPYYPVQLVRPVNVLMDSGAFQDVGKQKRLSFNDALSRQLNSEKIGGFISERIVSYDRLIDEQIDESGKQIKRRWLPIDAEDAVDETIQAAEYLTNHRESLSPRKLILSCQGTTIKQYCECAEHILNVAQSSDVFGYGGFCIIGSRQRSVTVDNMTYPEQFIEILKKTLPMMHDKGITEAHVFGVLLLLTLRSAVNIANQYGIHLSTDSSSVERNSVIEGKVWLHPNGFRGSKKLGKENKWLGDETAGYPPKGKWHPNLLALENISKAIVTLEEI